MAERYSTALPSPDSNFLAQFAQYLCARRGLGEVTIANHVNCIRRLSPQLGFSPAPATIDRLIVAMRQRGASYAHIVNTSVALERYMEFRGHPLKLGRPRKPRRLIRGTLTEAEMVLLLAAARNLRQKALLSLLAYAGLRNRELCALRVEDVDVAGQVVRVHASKTSRDRNANVAGECMAVLAEYLRARNAAGDELLFLTERRQLPLEPQDVRKLLKAAAQRAGIRKRVWPHLLRHSLATNLLHRGANVLAIKEQLGHAHLETTMIYVHSAPTHLSMQYRMFAPSYL